MNRAMYIPTNWTGAPPDEPIDPVAWFGAEPEPEPERREVEEDDAADFMNEPTQQEIIENLTELLLASNFDPKRPMTAWATSRLAAVQAKASALVERMTGKPFNY